MDHLQRDFLKFHLHYTLRKTSRGNTSDFREQLVCRWVSDAFWGCLCVLLVSLEGPKIMFEQFLWVLILERKGISIPLPVLP